MNVRPYAEAAWQYRRAGWVGVIPVGYGPRKKNPPIKGYTGWAGADPSGADVQAWVDGKEGAWNIGLHLPPGIVVPDVDAYNGGEESLQRLAAAVGYGLPATWSSTARGEHSPSRHRFYRATLPEGRVWRDHPGGDKSGIDALHVGHRYAVVWPSIHPGGDPYHWYDPDGEPYEDVPEPGWMTTLDPAWVEILSKPGEPLPGTAADDATTMAALGRFRSATGPDGSGRPCRIVGKLLRGELTRIEAAKDRESAGGLHNPGQLYALAALGLEGHAGVRVALSQHQAAYVQARMMYRGETEQFADADWWRMFRGAVGKWLTAAGGVTVDRCDCDGPASGPAAAATAAATAAGELAGVAVVVREPGGLDDQWAGVDLSAPPPPAELVPAGAAGGGSTDPDEAFWSARKVLWHVRQFATARYASPWAALGVVLARVVAATPPQVQLPNIVGGYGSLNLFTALVARPGGGKGAAEGVAEECLEIDPRRSGAMTNFPTYALGSGEGLAHMFMKRNKPSRSEPNPEAWQYNTSALVTIAEIDTMTALQNRQGSTLGGQLRQAAMGEQLGFFYVDKDKRMPVPKHSYRLCLVAGVQPKRAQALLDDAGGGTPQRFVWLPATLDPGTLPAPEDMPEEPEPLLWVAPAWPVAQVRAGMARTVMPLPPVAVEHTITLRRLHAEDQGDPLDGHVNFVRLKVAAALAILDGRAEVDEDDWALSGVVMARSAHTRQRIVDELAAERREANTAAAEAEAHKTIIVADRVDQKDRQQVAATIRNKLAKVAGSGDGWLARAVLRKSVAGKVREFFDPVLDGLASSGELEMREIEYHGRAGVEYRLAKRG